jgi:hypothetical protein
MFALWTSLKREKYQDISKLCPKLTVPIRSLGREFCKIQACSLIHEGWNKTTTLLRMCRMRELKNSYNRIFPYATFQQISHLNFALVNQHLCYLVGKSLWKRVQESLKKKQDNKYANGENFILTSMYACHMRSK